MTKRGLGLAVAVMSALACAAASACDDFSGTGTPDSGVADATVADVTAPPPPEQDAAPFDAGPVVESVPSDSCRSKWANPDGGCQPLVFVTDRMFHGDILGSGPDGGLKIAGANRACDQAANTNGKFMALLSDHVNNALTTLTSHGPIADRIVRRSDGVRVAASYHAIAQTLSLEAAISMTATKADVTLGDRVWTGTTFDGHAGDGNVVCLDWQTAEAGVAPNQGIYGFVTADASAWLQDKAKVAQSCNNINHLYCFEIDETP